MYTCLFRQLILFIAVVLLLYYLGTYLVDALALFLSLISY
jgi:hypothetical protein